MSDAERANEVNRDLKPGEEFAGRRQVAWMDRDNFRSLVQNASDLISILGADGSIRYESPSIERMLGYDAEELVGRNAFDLIHPDDRERVFGVFSQVVENPGEHLPPVEFRFMHGDGSWRYLEAVGLNRLDDPKIAGVVVNSRDVTDRKRLEDTLRRREEHFRALIRNAPDTITILEADGTIRYDSPSIERVLGYSPGERVGTSGFDYIHPEDRELGRQTFKEALENPAIGKATEYRLRARDGSWRHVEVIRTNLLDDPAVGGVVVNYRDVTERRRAEEDLRESEERHRRLVENSPEIIVILSEGKIAFINAAGAKLAGMRDRDQLIGKPYLDFVHPDFREESAERVERAVRGGKSGLMHQKLYRPDGRVIDVEVVTIPTVHDGKPAAQSIIRDITERKAAEDALRASEERFRGAFETTSAGMALISLKRRFLRVNHALCGMLGYSEEELLSKTTADVTHPEDIEASEERAQRLLTGGAEDHSLEKRYIHADGHTLWVVSDVSVALDSEGSPSHFVSMFQDVTERRRAEEALRASEERFRSVVQNSSEVIKIVALDGTLKYASPAMKPVFGYDPEDHVGTNVLDFVHPEDLPMVLEETERTLKDPLSASNMAGYRYRHADGSWRYVESIGTYLLDEPGIEGVVVNVRDVTDRRRAEMELRESEERYRAVVEQSIESIYLFDPQTKRILESNAALEQLLGYNRDELLGMTLYDIVAHPEEDIDLTVEGHLLEGQRFIGERKYCCKDGNILTVSVSASVIPYSDGQAICAVARDVTEQKALEEQLTHQAFHDQLTGLPNRALFLDRLDHALARVRRDAGSVAVLFVDLDDFKSVNDSLGHEAGDVLLGEVARRLQSCVRPGDTVARLFGDEFGVLLDAPAEIEEARRVTERIMERLRAPFQLDSREVFVTGSVGISSGPVSGDPGKERPKDVLRRADLAMYAAKTGGKSQYEIFNPSMNTRALERMEMRSELRRAVEKEEFEVHYQPMVEIQTGEVAGMEALVRWRHPERGLVAAEDFIELAEDTGLIHPIGEAVFGQVCLQTQRWLGKNPAPPFVVSVNFSASQFANQADAISRAIGETGIDPEFLVIEITERAVMDNAEFALGKLRRLKGLGIQFAIDDYGTGYSCLRYLKLMPVDFLKIDSMFIAGLGSDPGDTAIVQGTINLAHALGLKVVAEGVETAAQYERLKELDCDMAQGLYLSRPLSTEEATHLLESPSPRLPR